MMPAGIGSSVGVGFLIVVALGLASIRHTGNGASRMNGAYNVELRLAVTFAVSSMIHTAGYTDLIIGLGDMEVPDLFRPEAPGERRRRTTVAAFDEDQQKMRPLAATPVASP